MTGWECFYPLQKSPRGGFRDSRHPLQNHLISQTKRREILIVKGGKNLMRMAITKHRRAQTAEIRPRIRFCDNCDCRVFCFCEGERDDKGYKEKSAISPKKTVSEFFFYAITPITHRKFTLFAWCQNQDRWWRCYCW